MEFPFLAKYTLPVSQIPVSLPRLGGFASRLLCTIPRQPRPKLRFLFQFPPSDFRNNISSKQARNNIWTHRPGKPKFSRSRSPSRESPDAEGAENEMSEEGNASRCRMGHFFWNPPKCFVRAPRNIKTSRPPPSPPKPKVFATACRAPSSALGSRIPSQARSGPALRGWFPRRQFSPRRGGNRWRPNTWRRRFGAR